ncbi:MAG TPA: RNA 3'-terminal phosphate cyclase [Verrucomicrobiae bacterium]|nr:RNA 3'-terminal phosphate cyclase [Verrucomicrobiae bacterium]
MIIIDGSSGEGGGQILRSALTISIIVKKSIHVINIRKKRNNPGLRPQHVATIITLSELFNFYTENVVVGAEWVKIVFDKEYGKKIVFDKHKHVINIGTAGSIPLLLQALIPSISISQKSIDLELIGGTDVKYSPTIDYIKYVMKEAFNKIGIFFNIDIIKRGFYPRGNGIVNVSIKKSDVLNPIDFCNFKETNPNIISIVGKLPKHIADRQISSALLNLEKNGIKCEKYKSIIETSESPGSSILIYSTSESKIYLGADSIGEKNIRSETIGKNVSKKFLEEYKFRSCIDCNLADMLVLPLSFVKEKSRYKISKISKHLLTNLETIKRINGMEYQIETFSENEYIITIKGSESI